MHKTFRPAVVQGDATIVHTAQIQQALGDLRRRQATHAKGQQQAQSPYTAWSQEPRR